MMPRGPNVKSISLPHGQNRLSRLVDSEVGEFEVEGYDSHLARPVRPDARQAAVRHDCHGAPIAPNDFVSTILFMSLP